MIDLIVGNLIIFSQSSLYWGSLFRVMRPKDVITGFTFSCIDFGNAGWYDWNYIRSISTLVS